MKIETIGTVANPTLLLLPGMLCSKTSQQPLIDALEKDYFVIFATYGTPDKTHPIKCSSDNLTGNINTASTNTSGTNNNVRNENTNNECANDTEINNAAFKDAINEAQQLYAWLKENHITQLELALGSSLGANVLMAFAQNAERDGFPVKHYVFDGGLFFHIPHLAQAVIIKKFQELLAGTQKHAGAKHGKNNPSEELLENPTIQKLLGADNQAYRNVISDMIQTAQTTNPESIKAMLSAYCTGSTPAFSLESQRKFLFIWGAEEPAQKSESKLRKTYPGAQFHVEPGVAHLGYQINKPAEYAQMLKELIGTPQPKTTGVAIDVAVREYVPKDLEPVMFIWNQVVEDGIAFPQDEPLTKETAPAFFEDQTYTGVAVNKNNGEILGVYILHPNNVGRCGHVCNASYAVRKDIRGAHIGEKMVKDCLRMAHEKGFRILQFNAVVASNVHAIHLYERLGFTTIGRVKEGFRMPDGSYEDTLLFYHPV